MPLRLVLLLGLVLLMGPFCRAQSTLFSQDFNGSTVVSDYQSASPNSGQFTLIGAGGAGTLVTIENGQLKMDRTANANSGRFIRQSDFPGPPLSLYIQFKISGSSTGNNNGAVDFNVGSISGTSPVTPQADIHSRIGFAAGGGGWQLRNIGGSNDGQVITGSVQITWVINKAGRTLSYLTPGGGTATVSDSRADVWVDSRLAFDELAAVTASQNLTQLKFYFDAGQGVLFLDDLLIRDVAGSLPVELTDFRAQPSDDGTVTLLWETASEHDSRYFAVERSADLRDFTEIARREAAGASRQIIRYACTDARPLPGLNYYRLRQVDRDGTEQVFRPVSVTVRSGEGEASLFPNPSSQQEITLTVESAADAVATVFTSTGEPVPCSTTVETPFSLRLRPLRVLPPGTYFVRLQGAERQHTLRWVVE